MLVLHFCQNVTNLPNLPYPAQLPVKGKKVCHIVMALTQAYIEVKISPYRTYLHILSLWDIAFPTLIALYIYAII